MLPSFRVAWLLLSIDAVQTAFFLFIFTVSPAVLSGGFRFQEGISEFAVYVSCDDPQSWEQLYGLTTRVASSVASRLGRQPKLVEFWRQKPDPEDTPFKRHGLYKIAAHFRMALQRAFSERGNSHVILVEEDLVLAPDFLEFFSAGARVMEADTTVWCVSAWNDNGLDNLVRDERRLFRTDYFPGLGWMLKKEVGRDRLI